MTGVAMSAIKTILVVDDSAVERLYLSELLKSQGYQVLEASNGNEAYTTAKQTRPDLVLMDVVMPQANGFQTTRQFSRDADLSNIPIIMSTSKNAETDQLWAARQGAKGYLIKPVQAQQLFDLLNKLLT
jgi:twitching motility two-component system response regulator PilH